MKSKPQPCLRDRARRNGGHTFFVAHAEQRPWSERAANAAIERWPDGRLALPAPTGLELRTGTLLEGMDAVWLNTTDPRYFNYIKSAVDQFVRSDVYPHL